MWREMGITNSYTMEATFCGSQLGTMAGLQFKSEDLERMGFQLCDTILDYCDPDQSKVKCIGHPQDHQKREATFSGGRKVTFFGLFVHMYSSCLKQVLLDC